MSALVRLLGGGALLRWVGRLGVGGALILGAILGVFSIAGRQPWMAGLIEQLSQSVGAEGAAALAYGTIASIVDNAVTAWRAMTDRLASLIVGYWAGAPASIGDIAALGVVAIVSAGRRVIGGDDATIAEMTDETRMTKRLRGRLKEIYQRDGRIAERADDDDVLDADADAMGPWCAKYMGFFTGKRDAEEKDLDQAWLHRAIMQNANLNLNAYASAFRGSAKDAIVTAVVTDSADEGHRALKRATKGGQGLGATVWASLTAGAVAILAGAGELISALVGG